MRLRRFALALFVLFGIPAACSAGPIEFRLTTTGFWADPAQPALPLALYPTMPSGIFVFDPAAGVPVRVPVVGYDPTRLPQPAPIDVHPDGTTHWNNDGYFRVDYRVTDVASGESIDRSVWGRAHLYNGYSDGRWGGDAVFWFGGPVGAQPVTFGGNDYLIWGQGTYTTEPPTLSVWVGPNPPVWTSPEPGTFALAALGLVPLALRRFRKN